MTEFFDLTEKKEKEPTNINEKYQMVFGSRLGREVLADILINFCNFAMVLDTNDPRAIAEYNIGIRILETMKIFTSKTNKIVVINTLCNNIR